jgi:hypothetical protein
MIKDSNLQIASLARFYLPIVKNNQRCCFGDLCQGLELVLPEAKTHQEQSLQTLASIIFFAAGA